jgi:hypothetical protein
MATINADTSNGLKLTSDTSGEIELQSAGTTKAKITSSGLQNASGSAITSQAGNNIIINGNMQIAQRATSTSSITNNGYYTVDRFQTFNDTMGTWTQSQSTTAPSGQGFATSLKMDCTTADASPSAADRLGIRQRFEGYNIAELDYGTASAQTTTLSFWVRSNKTGTYIAELYGVTDNRQISKSYTISSADTWEKKTITFAGDTGGTYNNDNSNELIISWYLGAGSDYTSGTLSTTWGAKTDADRAVGQVNLADSTSNEWYITGVQLEVGTTATPFEHLQYTQQYALCQRYYQTILDCNQSYVNAGMHVGGRLQFNTEMRANPTTTATVDTSANVDNSYTFYRVRTNSLGYYQSASAAGNFFWYTDFVMDSEL